MTSVFEDTPGHCPADRERPPPTGDGVLAARAHPDQLSTVPGGRALDSRYRHDLSVANEHNDPICTRSTIMLRLTSAEQIGGSVSGYHELMTSLTAQRSPATVRTGSRAVFLYIADRVENSLFCRIGRAPARRDLAAAAMTFVGIIYGWLAHQVLQTIAPDRLRRVGYHAE
jgi:hypothetical protein